MLGVLEREADHRVQGGKALLGVDGNGGGLDDGVVVVEVCADNAK